MTRSSIRTLRHDPDTQPFIVIWEVTRACALVCAHCRADAVPDRHPLELTTGQGYELLDDLATFGPPHPLVVLTGGDPFERSDLPDLVAHGTARGLSIALSPSVTPGLTPTALRTLRAAGAKAVSLSLDGATAAVHDGLRGVPGVFDATLDAAAEVRRAGLRLQVNTTVTRDTVDHLPDVLRTVQGFGAHLWSVFFLVPTGRGADLPALGPAEVEDVLHWLYDVSHHVAVKTTEAPHFRRVALQRAASPTEPVEAFGLGSLYQRLTASTGDLDVTGAGRRRPPRPPLDVNAGRGFAFVDHIGAVYPSGFLPVPAGSVREQPITTIYRQAPLFRQLRRPDALGGRCGRCEFRAVCGGSRSRAYATDGDPLAEDPACPYEPAVAAVPPSPRRGRPTTR